MSSAASNLVSKVWNYCNLLRDDGVSYGDYVEQLTYLLFLKMDYERTRPPYNQKSTIPQDYNWASLVELDGVPLERHSTLETTRIAARARKSRRIFSQRGREPEARIHLGTGAQRDVQYLRPARAAVP